MIHRSWPLLGRKGICALGAPGAPYDLDSLGAITWWKKGEAVGLESRIPLINIECISGIFDPAQVFGDASLQMISLFSLKYWATLLLRTFPRDLEAPGLYYPLFGVRYKRCDLLWQYLANARLPFCMLHGNKPSPAKPKTVPFADSPMSRKFAKH